MIFLFPYFLFPFFTLFDFLFLTFFSYLNGDILFWFQFLCLMVYQTLWVILCHSYRCRITVVVLFNSHLRNKEVLIFPIGNAILRLKFELMYDNIAVRYISHNDTRISRPPTFWKLLISFFRLSFYLSFSYFSHPFLTLSIQVHAFRRLFIFYLVYFSPPFFSFSFCNFKLFFPTLLFFCFFILFHFTFWCLFFISSIFRFFCSFFFFTLVLIFFISPLFFISVFFVFFFYQFSFLSFFVSFLPFSLISILFPSSLPSSLHPSLFCSNLFFHSFFTF